MTISGAVAGRSRRRLVFFTHQAGCEHFHPFFDRNGSITITFGECHVFPLSTGPGPGPPVAAAQRRPPGGGPSGTGPPPGCGQAAAAAAAVMPRAGLAGRQVGRHGPIPRNLHELRMRPRRACGRTAPGNGSSDELAFNLKLQRLVLELAAWRTVPSYRQCLSSDCHSATRRTGCRGQSRRSRSPGRLLGSESARELGLTPPPPPCQSSSPLSRPCFKSSSEYDHA